MVATASRQPLSPTNQPTNHADPPRPAPPPAANTAAKKSKGKKAADPVDTSKLVNDTIAQLERNQGREKSEEQEIEREVKKANRDLSHLLVNIQSPMQKVETVVKKYGELYAEMKRAERDYVKSKKRGDTLQKEKDQAKSEFNKAQTKLGTLEKLSRDFEKDNKKLRDENRRLQESESQNRDELHERLEAMAAEVSQTLEAQENNNHKQTTADTDPEDETATLDQDALFREKFKSFVDQYDLREIQFHSLLRVKDLELAQLTQQLTAARAQTDSESQKSRQLTSQVSTFSQTETELRGQLNVYVDKFKQVEETLNNSNDLFLTFRKEMEEMSKKTKRLEKDNHNLTRKQTLTNQNIATMAQDRIRLTAERDALKRKNDELERLCRGMQAQGRGGEDVEKRLQAVQNAEAAAVAASNASAATTTTIPLTNPYEPNPNTRSPTKPQRKPQQTKGNNATKSQIPSHEDTNAAPDSAEEDEGDDDDDDEDDSDYEYEEASSSPANSNDNEDEDDDEEDSTDDNDDEEYEEDNTEDLRAELAGLAKDAANSPKRLGKKPGTTAAPQSPSAKSKAQTQSRSPRKVATNGKLNGVK